MPARTVVFAGDNPSLTPLMYRQMSGRAGRRGFDLLGHVLFYGVPPATIQSILTAKLSSLRGHFPLNSSLILRELILHKHSEDKQIVQDSILVDLDCLLYHTSFVCWKRPSFCLAEATWSFNSSFSSDLYWNFCRESR